jgi:hypothetical protein
MPRRPPAAGLFAQINAGGFELRQGAHRKSTTPVVARAKGAGGGAAGLFAQISAGSFALRKSAGVGSSSKRKRRDTRAEPAAAAPGAKGGLSAVSLLAARQNLRKCSSKRQPASTSKSGSFFERALQQKFKHAFPAQSSRDSPAATPGKWD